MLSSWPVACWKRRLNSSSLASASALDEGGVVEVAVARLVLGHQKPSSRVTNRALIGSFWMARSMASRASSGSG